MTEETKLSAVEIALNHDAVQDWEAERRQLNHEETEQVDLLDELDPLDAMRAVLQFVVGGAAEKRNLNQGTAAALGYRMLALCRLLQIGDLGEMSLAEIGEKCHCTRALLSYYSIKFTDATGLNFRQQKRAGTRETYSQARQAACAAGMSDLHAHPWLDGEEKDSHI
jgi:hypothetical protein